jgi:diaminopimelate decarboxylase
MTALSPPTGYWTSPSYWQTIQHRLGLMNVEESPGHDESGGGRGVGPVPLSLLPDTAEVAIDGRLLIGGVDILAVVEHIGTPIFIYDEAHLRARCQQASCAFGEGVAYASKAFLCRAMAGLVHEERLMIDVASGGELYVALRAGVPPQRIVLHGSNKSPEELQQAIRLGLGRVVIDSFDEIERFVPMLDVVQSAVRPQVLIRVNPGISVRTHPSVATGQEDSKFGFSVRSGAAAEAIAKRRQHRDTLDLVGLHIHIGSQILDLTVMQRAIYQVAELLTSTGLAELCVGGGLGVAYASDDGLPPSFDDWARVVRDACRDAGIPGSVRITSEPGRAIAAGAAITCYRIGAVKSLDLGPEGGMRTYVSVDGGMSDNLRPALYHNEYEAFLPRAVTSTRPRAVRVVGKHCESGDILLRNGQLPADATVGDVLATPVTGAYGYAMASNYNKLPRPPILFVHDGEYRVVARRETYDDLLRLDVDGPICHQVPSSRSTLPSGRRLVR